MNIIARLAILFCGVIVAGAFLNLYIFVAIIVITPPLSAVGFNQRLVFSVLYWTCLAAGAVTAFFVMRPAWRSVGKKAANQVKSGNSTSVPNQELN